MRVHPLVKFYLDQCHADQSLYLKSKAQNSIDAELDHGPAHCDRVSMVILYKHKQ